MPNKSIHINPNGMIQDQDCRVRASKIAGDTVTWTSVGNAGPWTINFNNGTPFGSASITVTAGPNGTSGPQTPLADAALRKYTYQVKNSAGTITDDPDVIIET